MNTLTMPVIQLETMASMTDDQVRAMRKVLTHTESARLQFLFDNERRAGRMDAAELVLDEAEKRGIILGA